MSERTTPSAFFTLSCCQNILIIVFFLGWSIHNGSVCGVCTALSCDHVFPTLHSRIP